MTASHTARDGDTQVGKALFEEAIVTLLAGKTRVRDAQRRRCMASPRLQLRETRARPCVQVLVTNHMQYLRQSDAVVLMVNEGGVCRIAETGRYEGGRGYDIVFDGVTTGRAGLMS